MSAPNAQPPRAPLNSDAARDIAFHVHAQTNLDAHLKSGPFIISGGDGVEIIDDQGKRYIDALAGLWSASLGFSEKRLAEAAYRQMLELPYSSTFAGRSCAAVIDLAERLTAVAPEGVTRALFANSGSEAVDTALKLVWYYQNAKGRPEKKKVIAREKAYHGSTIAAASLTGLERMQREFDLPIDRIVRAPCPHYWRFGGEGESEDEFAARMADELEAIILREGADTIGGFIAEPLQGAGGVILPAEGYFRRVQAILKKHDIIFIADEVICGFGRTGAMWGSQTFSLKPDMVTCAKALSASYIPIAALLIADHVFDAMVDQSRKISLFGHGFTYSGHPVAAAVAAETLKIYEERNIVGAAQAVSPILQQGLRSFADHPLVGEVRGCGLIAGVELVEDKSTKRSFPASKGAGALVQEEAKSRGLLVRALGDSIAFCPPLIITEKELRAVVERFGDALEAASRKLA
ncbi:MAG: aminotransferase class III-fold pyridoxal phosphate-dependent enzyme [Parvularculaceae bacterium]|nr:aminotransferase class III-fold pyridoxal phosphate-dependent enzyme [Parvularculaceae bacterium]